MSQTSTLRKTVRAVLAAIALLLLGSKVFAVDSYSGGVLTMPTLAIGNATLSSVAVQVATIVTLPSGSSPNGTVDRYDPTTGHLTVQSVDYAGETFYNVVVTVKSLVSIGGLSGGDTYANGAVSIPFVRLLNGPLFGGAVVSQFKIDSAGGGMPLYEQDVYNAATHELTITAIEVGGKVYTNAVITVESATVAAYATVVPNLVGDTESAASAALAAAVLGGNVTQQPSATVPAGNIISQNPAAGTEVDEGTYVNLVISGGVPETLLYSFPTAGATPEAFTLIAAKGGLYGTTVGGGNANNGQIFSLSLGGAESTLYTFPSPAGAGTYSPNCLILGADGNFYGTTAGGGIDLDQNEGAGTVFQLTPKGALTTLWAFGDFLDGVQPNGVTQGSDGNFYGTTATSSIDSDGVLYQVTPAGVETVIHSFNYYSAPAGDGADPVGYLVEVPQLISSVYFGATSGGGANGTGIAFSINSSGTEVILHSFAAAGSTTDGQNPVGGLLYATNGIFYGMTLNGGANGAGAIYQISGATNPNPTEKVLYSFAIVPGTSSGPTPVGALVQTSDGSLYGITEFGGDFNYGSVFKITTSGAYSLVHSFSAGTSDGAQPSSLTLGSDGNLYGTTFFGGANNTGAVFKIPLQ